MTMLAEKIIYAGRVIAALKYSQEEGGIVKVTAPLEVVTEALQELQIPFNQEGFLFKGSNFVLDVYPPLKMREDWTWEEEGEEDEE